MNNYLDGINGHPLKIDSCISDASPATSARAAPDWSTSIPWPSSVQPTSEARLPIPVYERAGLDYFGGIPFTPVEQNAPNVVEFVSVSLGENAAGSVFVAKQLPAKTVVVMSVGYKGNLIGINPCTSPPAVASAAGGAEGMYFVSPFVLQTGSSSQTKLFVTAMGQYAAPPTPIDSISTMGFSESSTYARPSALSRESCPVRTCLPS